MIEENNKKKIFVSKSKPFVKTAGQIASEREKTEKDEKINEAAKDMSKLIDTFSNLRKEKKLKEQNTKPKGLKSFFKLIIALILLVFLINLLLFNIWAFGTMLKSIIGWFS